jgi:hypothetical protein
MKSPLVRQVISQKRLSFVPSSQQNITESLNYMNDEEETPSKNIKGHIRSISNVDLHHHKNGNRNEMMTL